MRKESLASARNGITPLCIAAVIVTVAHCSPALYAQAVPPLVNYQGRLVDSNNVPLVTGDYELRFSIWDDPTAGAQIWGPQVFDGQTGAGYGPLVPIVQGWFNVMLGPVDTNDVAIADAFAAADRCIEIQVGDDPSILPRQRILTAPYAFRAETARTADQARFLIGAVTTQPIGLYVSTNGLDSHDGLSPESPKRTIQAAIDSLPNDIRHSASINVEPGIYRENLNYNGKRAAGSMAGTPVIVGNGASPNDVVLSGADENGEPGAGYGVFVRSGNLQIWNLRIEKYGYGIGVARNGELELLNCMLENNRTGGMEIWADSFVVANGLTIGNSATAALGVVVREESFLSFGASVGSTIQDCPLGLDIQSASTVIRTGLSMTNVTTPIRLTGGGTAP